MESFEIVRTVTESFEYSCVKVPVATLSLPCVVNSIHFSGALPHWQKAVLDSLIQLSFHKAAAMLGDHH